MAICRYFQQGNCRFGNSCRFEHPGKSNGSSNPFGPLSGGSSNNGGSGGGRFGGGSVDDRLAKYNLSTDIIEKDLTSERPTWILSAYGPGRGAPDQLFGGEPREKSMEEVRLAFYQARASNNEQQELNTAQQMYTEAEKQMENAKQNLQQALLYILEGENRHPNRFDVCQMGTKGQPFGVFDSSKKTTSSPFGPSTTSASSNPFSTSSNTSTGPGSSPFGAPSGSAFGQTSTLGQKPNPFGQPTSAFGAEAKPNPFASTTSPSPFGQPAPQNTATLGTTSQPSGSTFGQPSSSGPSAFGQPSTLGSNPSPFGAPSAGAFGQPASSTSAQGSAFGQASQLGQKPNPFGAPSTNTASPFGGSSTSAPNPFGSTPSNASNKPNPFASPADNTNQASPSPFSTGNTGGDTKPNPFGAPAGQSNTSPFGSANQPPATGASPFGQPSQTQSPFGQPTGASSGNAFGTPNQTAQPNPFASTPQQNSSTTTQAANPFASAHSTPFGQASGATASQPNPFGQPIQQAASNTATAAAVKATGNPYSPESGKEHVPVEQYISRMMDGTITQFKGQSVVYKDGKPGYASFKGLWTRIWFPAGPPSYNRDTALAAEEYDARSKEQWQAFEQIGEFKDGLMPALPPPREVCRWDF